VCVLEVYLLLNGNCLHEIIPYRSQGKNE